MKRYICIKDDIPVGHAVNVASHLADALTFTYGHTANFKCWKSSSLRSVIVKVNDEQFEELKKFEDGIIFREDAINWKECGIAFPPKMEHPHIFSSLQLFDGKKVESVQLRFDFLEEVEMPELPAPR